MTKGIFKDPDLRRQNISKAMTGIPKSKEHNEKVALSRKLNPYKHSKERLDILSGIANSRPLSECEYCGKIMDINHIKQYHGDNCPQNPDYVDKRKPLTCPHCGKIGYGGLMYYRHFDNCKNKLIV